MTTTTTPKARPFPAQQDYSPAVRQYLNRLANVEAAGEDQFGALSGQMNTLHTAVVGLTASVGSLETQTAALTASVSETLETIDQLQTESVAQAEAIDLLNARYDTARTDLDAALADITTLTRDLAQATQTLEDHTAAISILRADVAALQYQDGITTAVQDAMELQLAAMETTLTTVETEIRVLQWTDSSLNERLAGVEFRLDSALALLASTKFAFRVPLSDAILGTIPKIVGALVLPAGDYAAAQAYLGCPTTPSFSAIFQIVVEADDTVLAEITGPGTMAWQTATTDGFTLAEDTAVNLLLVGSSAPASAIIKGFVLLRA